MEHHDDPTDEIRDQLEEQTALLDSIASDVSWVALASKVYLVLLAIALVFGVLALIAMALDTV